MPNEIDRIKELREHGAVYDNLEEEGWEMVEVTLMKDTKYAIGGLMRCCTGTIQDKATDEPDLVVHEGDTLECKYEKDKDRSWPNMIYLNGAWRWNMNKTLDGPLG